MGLDTRGARGTQGDTPHACDKGAGIAHGSRDVVGVVVRRGGVGRNGRDLHERICGASEASSVAVKGDAPGLGMMSIKRLCFLLRTASGMRSGETRLLSSLSNAALLGVTMVQRA